MFPRLGGGTNTATTQFFQDALARPGMSAARMSRLIEVTRRADPDLHAWLVSGFQKWRGGECLDRALGLNGRGARRAAEDALLRAARLLDPDGARSGWELARNLADALQYFKDKTWPRTRLLDEPDGLSALDLELWTSLKNSEGVRCSPRRLHELILDRLNQFCPTQPPAVQLISNYLTRHQPPSMEI